MFLTACLLVAVAVCVCAAGVRKTFRVLEIDPMQMLMWMGLAETPLPSAPRRSRDSSAL